MEENIALVFRGFLNLTNLEKLKFVDEINNYFDSNNREPIRKDNEEQFQKIETDAANWKCKCCGR